MEQRCFLYKCVFGVSAWWDGFYAQYQGLVLHFGRKMKIPAQFLDTILHFRRKTAISAQSDGTILHFRRKMKIPAQFLDTTLHFRRKTAISAQFLDTILHFRRKTTISGHDFAFWRENDGFCTICWIQAPKEHGAVLKTNLWSSISIIIITQF